VRFEEPGEDKEPRLVIPNPGGDRIGRRPVQVHVDALRALGQEENAREAEGRFERQALENVDKADNENHDLVLFYLERRPDPAKALSIARRESGRRQDIHTMDRLAVALAAGGHPRQAQRILRRVLEVGTRDPLIRAHAAALQLRIPS